MAWRYTSAGNRSGRMVQSGAKAEETQPFLDPDSFLRFQTYLEWPLVINRQDVPTNIINGGQGDLQIERYIIIAGQKRHGDRRQGLLQGDRPDLANRMFMGTSEKDKIRGGRQSLLHRQGLAVAQQINFDQ